MLEMIKSDEMVSVNEVADKYEGCKYLMVDINYDMDDLRGKLYCVSSSKSSWDEICKVSEQLEDAGKEVAILGIYADGYACGLQYKMDTKA